MLQDHPVRVDKDGYFCLTDIWRATGREHRNRPNVFLRNDKTRDYIAVLEKAGKSAFYTVPGRNGGTYASRHIAYEFVGWSNPEFKEMVYQILDAYFNGDLKTEKQWLMQQELQQFAFDEGRSREGGTIGSKLMLRRKKEKHVLERQAVVLLKKFQYELELIPAS